MTLAQRAMNLAGSLFGFYFANLIFTKELDSIENVVGKKEYAVFSLSLKLKLNNFRN